MQELRTVVTNLKSLRHSQIEFLKKIKQLQQNLQQQQKNLNKNQLVQRTTY